MRSIFALALVALFALPSFAAKDMHSKADRTWSSQKTQFHLNGALLFAGGTTIGPAIGVDFSMHKYVRLGARFAANFYPGLPLTWLDFDAIVKGQYPLKVGNHEIVPYLAVPLGFTLGLGSAALGGTTYGFNFSIAPGFEWFFHRNWGAFVELGFSLHATGNAGGFGAFPTGAFNFGFTYAM